MKHFFTPLLVLIVVSIFSIDAKASSIQVSGTISTNTTWSSDTVYVIGDVIVNNLITLTINPGTYVIFNGNYRLDIDGRLLAQGTKDNKITMTAANTTVGWAGMEFRYVSNLNSTSIIEYCEISRAYSNGSDYYDNIGGAIFCYGSSDLIIRNNILSNNYASYFGGAIACWYNSSPKIINNIICNNTASSMGGGIFAYSNSQPDIINNTIVNNQASSNGGGICAYNVNPNIVNCIIRGNYSNSNPQVGKSGYATNITYSNVEGGYSGTGNTDTNALFVSPSSGYGYSYDGLSADWSLQSNSPAINTGTNNSSYAYMPDFDVDGNFRYDENQIDKGALEYISSIVACGNISSNTTWSGSVLLSCNVVVNNGVTLTIEPGTNVLALGQYNLDINGRLLAQGTYDSLIKFSSYNKQIGWFGIDFYGTSSTNDTSKIDFCLIRDGKANGTSSMNMYGGAVHVYNFSKLLIRNSFITNNTATYYGGGIALRNSNAKVINSVIVNNTTDYNYGGGIYTYGTSYSPEITNNTIANNLSDYSGGGIYNLYASSVLKNNIIYNNQDLSGNHNSIEQLYSSVSLNISYCDVEGGVLTGTGNTSLDPLFENPSSGVGAGYNGFIANWSLGENSPLIDSGTPSAAGLDLLSLDIIGKTRVYSSAIDMGAFEDKSSLSVCGTISSNTVWDANTINVNCDVTVNPGVTLTINPGTKVVFQGSHFLKVDGRLLAQGTISDSILFTAADSTIGWDGIHFYYRYSYEDSSIFNYCIVNYANRNVPTYNSYLYGGGFSIYRTNNLRISNSRISDNTVSGLYAKGAGICVYYSNPNIYSCEIKNNYSDRFGGGMYVLGCDRDIYDLIITRNSATSNGGGLYVSSCENNFYNNKISNNSANSYGGGIYFISSVVANFYNNLIVNNSAFSGGGLYITSDAKPIFINNTIATNLATYFGGGIYLSSNSDVILKNNIFYGDSASNSGNEVYISDVSSDPKIYNCNIEGGRSEFKGNGSGIQYVGVYINNIDQDPLFTNPSSSVGLSYNGLNADFSIQSGSPCINQGLDDASTSGVPSFDLANNVRVYNGNIDIGAYENLDDIVADCYITEDTYWNADTIKVNCDITIEDSATLFINPGTYVLFSGYYGIDVKGRIIANGTSDEMITFSIDDTTGFYDNAANTGAWAGFEFNSTATTNDSSKIVYCKIIYCKINTTSYYSDRGGAFYIYNFSKLIISNSLIANNKASFFGGGMYIESGSPKIINNIIVNNEAVGSSYPKGGGIYVDDGNPIIVNNTIANNRAEKYGGAMFISSSTATVENNIVYGNEDYYNINYSYYSSGIYAHNANNSTFNNNNIEGGINGVFGSYQLNNYSDNINIDPEFINESAGAGASFDGIFANWNITTNSPCINEGTNLASNYYGVEDYTGNTRTISDTVDIGAFEVQISSKFINQQPLDKVVCENLNTTFNVSTGINANYQWKKDGSVLIGETNSNLIISNAALADSGSYYCVISNGFGSIITDTVSLTIEVAPNVTSNPSIASSCLGDTASFSISADGTNPLTYQWYNTNGQVPGGTNNTYIINSVTANDVSNYYCIVTNSCGIDQSNGANLTYKTLPSISSLPSTYSVCETNPIPLSVSATSNPSPTYQWYKDGSSLSGQTSVQLSISSAATTDQGNYYCKASNVCGADSSNIASVIVNEEPEIVAQSASSSVCIGQSLTLSATATGAQPLNYQWYKNSIAITGATNNTYTINSVSSSDAATYSCKATNSCAFDETSGIIISVNSAPSITAQPTTSSVCEGSSQSFSLTASGTAPLSYQWYDANGAISGASNNIYTISSTTTSDNGTYYCIVSNTCGSNQSSSVQLSVQTAPTVTNHPSSLNKCEGQSVQFAVNNAGSAPYSYQWYFDNTAITGATNSSYLKSPVSTSDDGNYYVEITNTCGSVNSNIASLTVDSAVNITSVSSSSTVCSGSSQSLSITTNGTQPITYQWYDNNGAISGASNNIYTINSTTTSDNGTYYCIVSNTCGSIQSSSAQLSVQTAPTVTSHPSSLNKCEGQSVQFAVNNGGSAPYSYQWYFDNTAIAGATNSSYLKSPVSTSDDGNYYVEITNTCGSVNSNIASLTVDSAVNITSVSSSSTVCSGSSQSLSITTNGTQPITYQWYDNNGAISGASNNIYTINSTTTSDNGTYYCIVSNTCGSIQSSSAQLSVQTAPTVTSHPSSLNKCEGQSVQFAVNNGGSAPYSYQWYFDNTAIAGATNSSYLKSPVSTSDDGNYYVEITNTCGSVNSNIASLTVDSAVNITSVSSSSTICSGSSQSLSITTNGTQPITYQWYDGNGAITGATNNTYSASNQANYYCIATNICASATSNNIGLSVNNTPTVVSHPNSTSLCENQSLLLTTNAIGSQPLSYQWYDNNGAITGAISSNYLINSVDTNDAGNYYCQISNTCGNINTNSATVTVNTPVSIVYQSGDSTKCFGESITFNVNVDGTGPYTYQWYKTGTSILGANSSAYIIAAVDSNSAGSYYCNISNVCNNVQSTSKNLSIQNNPNVDFITNSDTICEGLTKALTVNASGSNNITYQWYKNSQIQYGSTSNMLLLPAVTTNDAASYYCVATNQCGNTQSNDIVIGINENVAFVSQSADSSKCEAENTSFEVNVSGTAPYTYQWYFDGIAISNADSNYYAKNNLSIVDDGNYYCEVSNVCNTTNSNNKYLSVNQNPVINLGNDTTFCNGGSVSLSAGFGYQCIWSNGSYNNQILVVDSGAYWVDVVDQNGCSGSSDTVNVNVVKPYADQELCIVGVDSATSKNIVIWEKTPNINIESFNIYKESSVQGVYYLIYNSPYDSLAEYVDLSSNPVAKAAKYKISIIDSCGNESPLSNSHKTMHLTVNQGAGGSWNLIWDPYQGFAVSTYKIWRADTSLNWTLIDSVSGGNWTYADVSQPSGKLYYQVEIVKPGGPCNPTKANTNYNSSRSNVADNGIIVTTLLQSDFYANPTQGIVPLVVNFYPDVSNGIPTSHYWNFGDGNTSAAESPAHQYDSTGIYDVTLTVSNADGTNSKTRFDYIDVLTNGYQINEETYEVSIAPNPFDNLTLISYYLPKSANVRIEIYNSIGQIIVSKGGFEMAAGEYKYEFKADNSNYAMGIYYLKIIIDDNVLSKKLIHIR